MMLLMIETLTCQQIYGAKYIIFEWIPLEPQLHHHDAYTPHISRRVVRLTYTMRRVYAYTYSNICIYLDICANIHKDIETFAQAPHISRRVVRLTYI